MLTRSLLLFLSATTCLHAEIKLASLFTDHVILQRDQPVPIWGTAKPGEAVTVVFGGQTVTTKTDTSGRWQTKLAPLPASSDPRDFVARGTNTITVHDVVVGDVWLASGQSNMASPLSSGSAAQALPEANDPLLRFFNVTKAVAAEPQTELGGKWDVATPDAAKSFSSVAYFFAREIRQTQKVPVAIICAAWGGTPIQTWMSLDSIRQAPPITKTVATWDEALAKHLAVKDKPELTASYLADMKDWADNVQPALKAAVAAHNAEADTLRAAGKTVGPAPTPSRPEPEQPDPMSMPAPSKRPHTPSIAYNGMIAPVQPYALRGMLWYQGEENGSAGMDYRTWFPRLIEGWRAAWKQSDLPFIFVQLPACYKDLKPVAESGWPFTREAQFMTLKVPKTAMAVTLDIGDPSNVHPDNKVHVGHRVALLARKLVYGEKIVASGPLYKDFTVEGAKVKVRFTDADGGLCPGRAPWTAKGVEPLPADHLVGFYIASEDKRWVEASAQIEGDTITVSSPEVPKPVAVRYGWASSPRANLYNKEGLPASPFRTDMEAAK